ncbi:protein NRT1/ PTR FAMILY 5.5-like [Henckelia pumila]|uniref:protein NRT1/ PTR FAMILY 5.5-like n=1 Tax=Henckelia pumila TaxID=405737 RepID=UPI003C6DC926
MHAPRIVIGLAMIHSVLCCVTAAKIEGTRLQAFREHKSDNEVVHMSTRWLLFQFFLLAGLDSLFESGVVSLYRNQAPESLEGYLKYISKGVSGLGYMFSVIFVNRIMQINDGSKDWFQTTLNMSRLDKYYWLLAMISSANLAAYIFVACFYWRKEADHKKRMDDGDQAGAGSL